MADRFSFQGYSAPSGNLYASVEDERAKAIRPLGAFSLANKSLATDLALQGINVFDKKELDDLIREVRYLPVFDAAIAEHVGWNARAYVFPDGRAVTPAGIENWPVTFTADTGRYVTAGSMKEWKALAKLLAGHPLPAFSVMLPFMAILLRFMPNVPNAVFELEGPSGVSKRTLQLLAASVVGHVGIVGSSSNIVPLETMVQDPIAVLDRYRDQLVIIDHVAPALSTLTDKEAARVYKAIAYDPPGLQTRYVGLASVNRTLRSLVLGANTDGDGLITLRIPDGPHGVFSAPDNAGGHARFAESLIAAATAAHGHAVMHFLAKLVATDGNRLKTRLEAWQTEFLCRAGIDGNDGVRHRIARVFAGVYAAGMEARRRGSLPKAFRPMDAVLSCMQLWRDTLAPPKPFVERLRELIDAGRIITITPGADPEAQRRGAQIALGALHSMATCDEVRMRADMVLVAFSDWDQIKKTEGVRACLKVDGKNLRAWSHLAPGMERERLYCFKLPRRQEESLFSAAARPTDVDEVLPVAPIDDDLSDW
jgi:hypothetical protein